MHTSSAVGLDPQLLDDLVNLLHLQLVKPHYGSVHQSRTCDISTLHTLYATGSPIPIKNFIVLLQIFSSHLCSLFLEESTTH